MTEIFQIESRYNPENKCDTILQTCFTIGKNILGKRENAGYQHFLLYLDSLLPRYSF